jgi:hypothetical protein
MKAQPAGWADVFDDEASGFVLVEPEVGRELLERALDLGVDHLSALSVASAGVSSGTLAVKTASFASANVAAWTSA